MQCSNIQYKQIFSRPNPSNAHAINPSNATIKSATAFLFPIVEKPSNSTKISATMGDRVRAVCLYFNSAQIIDFGIICNSLKLEF